MTPDIGTVGRSVTEVGESGRVIIDDVEYPACTHREPIPAGTIVEVSGVCTEKRDQIVLHVRRYTKDLWTYVLNVDNRTRALGQVHYNYVARDAKETEGFPRFVLTVGQVIATVSCACSIIATAWAVATLIDRVIHPIHPSRVFVVFVQAAGGLLTFCVSAALFIVFGRVKRLPPKN